MWCPAKNIELDLLPFLVRRRESTAERNPAWQKRGHRSRTNSKKFSTWPQLQASSETSKLKSMVHSKIVSGLPKRRGLDHLAVGLTNKSYKLSGRQLNHHHYFPRFWSHWSLCWLSPYFIITITVTISHFILFNI